MEITRLATVVRWALCALSLSGCARARERLDAEQMAASINDVKAKQDDAGAQDAPRADATHDASAVEEVDAAPAEAKDETDASLPHDSGATALRCEATTTCALAQTLGSISGDSGSDTITTSGVGSTFVAVQVTENDHVPLVPRALRIQATLTSVVADFDLFLYADGQGCAAPTAVSMLPNTDIVMHTWEDIQSTDVGRLVVIEIRHASGRCDPATPWTLTVRGN